MELRKITIGLCLAFTASAAFASEAGLHWKAVWEGRVDVEKTEAFASQYEDRIASFEKTPDEKTFRVTLRKTLPEGMSREEAAAALRRDPRLKRFERWNSPQGASPFILAAGAEGEEKDPLQKELGGAAKETVEDLVGNLDAERADFFFDGAVERGDLRDSVSGTIIARGGRALPPPPGGRKPRGGRPLPPPPGRGGRGKPLPPPPGGGKPLPPPPGGGKPLPPPVNHPRPIYPGGPLSRVDHRLMFALPVGLFTDPNDLQYVGYWVLSEGYQNAKGSLRRDGKNPGTNYNIVLRSRYQKKKRLFYYDRSDRSYVYRDHNDSVRAPLHERRIEIEFLEQQDHPLLPWEKESFDVFFDPGGSPEIRFSVAQGAYRYQSKLFSNGGGGRDWRIEVVPTSKVRTRPDASGITVRMEKRGSRIAVVFSDRWADYYKGEELHISVHVKKKEPWYRADKDALKRDKRNPLKFTADKENEYLFTPRHGGGKYYLKGWSIRRANSKISSDVWIGQRQGGSVRY